MPVIFIIFFLLVCQEHLHMARNKLIQIHGDLPTLQCLRTINVRHNKIRNSGIPNDIFGLDDITVVVSLIPVCYEDHKDFYNFIITVTSVRVRYTGNAEWLHVVLF